MKIHYSGKLTGIDFKFHGSFDVQATAEQAKQNSETLVKVAVSKFRDKIQHYEYNFEDTEFLEVYFYENGEEINIYKKQKK